MNRPNPPVRKRRSSPHRPRSRTAGRFLLTCLGALGAAAAHAEREDAGARCAAIESAQDRLLCYDALHGRSQSEPTPPTREPRAAPPPDASPPVPEQMPETAPAADLTTQQERGRADPASQDGAAKAQASEPPVLQVVETGQRATGRLWFRLDNGEVWEQITMERSQLDVGRRVQVSRSSFGSYFLRRADGVGRSTRVRKSR